MQTKGNIIDIMLSLHILQITLRFYLEIIVLFPLPMRWHHHLPSGKALFQDSHWDSELALPLETWLTVNDYFQRSQLVVRIILLEHSSYQVIAFSVKTQWYPVTHKVKPPHMLWITNSHFTDQPFCLQLPPLDP